MNPKVLIFDIETSPMLTYVWGLGDQYVGLDQLHTDRYIIAWGAKWLGQSQVMYQDQRNKRDYKNDKELVKAIWKLLDEADIVITYNGESFDSRRLNARFMAYGMKPPSPYRHIDVYKVSRAKADFPSHKLAYQANRLCTTYPKLSHSEYPGLSLWVECMAGNKKAWAAMRTYNIHDVLSTEELYNKLKAWVPAIAPPVFIGTDVCARCGGKQFRSKGWAYTAMYRTQRLICKGCGAPKQGKREKR